MILTSRVTVIDPPSGWMYGFPKILPDSVGVTKIKEWLVANGYPQSEIDSYGKHFRYRMWQTDIQREFTR